MASLKICTKCKKPKPLKEFRELTRYSDGRDSWCKDCHILAATLYRKNNPKKMREYYRNRYKQNPEKMKKNSLRWQKSNKEKYYASIYRWGKANPSKIQTHRRRCYKRRSNTAKGKLNNSLSSGIGHSLKYGKNGRHWEDLVGYTLASLMKHLEKQFESWMTWENYGKKGWEIDHIIPVTVFNYETPDDLDFKRCWALKNLRPMEAIENIIKSNKLTEHFQPSLLMNCNKET